MAVFVELSDRAFDNFDIACWNADNQDKDRVLISRTFLHMAIETTRIPAFWWYVLKHPIDQSDVVIYAARFRERVRSHYA